MDNFLDRIVTNTKADSKALMKQINREEAERRKEEEEALRRQQMKSKKHKFQKMEYEQLKMLNMAKYKAIRDGDPF